MMIMRAHWTLSALGFWIKISAYGWSWLFMILPALVAFRTISENRYFQSTYKFDIQYQNIDFNFGIRP
jgi:hypothetical protein